MTTTTLDASLVAYAAKTAVALALVQHPGETLAGLRAVLEQDLHPELANAIEDDGQGNDGLRYVLDELIHDGRVAAEDGKLVLVDNPGEAPRGEVYAFASIDDVAAFFRLVLGGTWAGSRELRHAMDMGGKHPVVGKLPVSSSLQAVADRELIAFSVEDGTKTKRLYFVRELVRGALPAAPPPAPPTEEPAAEVVIPAPAGDESKLMRLRTIGDSIVDVGQALKAVEYRLTAKESTIADLEGRVRTLHAERDEIVRKIDQANGELEVARNERAALVSEVKARKAAYLQAVQQHVVGGVPIVVERGGQQLHEWVQVYAKEIRARYGYAYTPGADAYEEIGHCVRRNLVRWGLIAKDDKRPYTSLTNEEVVKLGFKALIMVVEDLAGVKGDSHQMPWFHGKKVVLP